MTREQWTQLAADLSAATSAAHGVNGYAWKVLDAAREVCCAMRTGVHEDKRR